MLNMDANKSIQKIKDIKTGGNQESSPWECKTGQIQGKRKWPLWMKDRF